jgi:hypothetical protein
MRWRTHARTDVQIPWKNFKATNLGFNAVVKKRFFRDYLLHLTGFRHVDRSDVNLNSYVAMYYDRLATMNDDCLAPEKKSFERYITEPKVEEEIKNRSKELLTDDVVAAPMLGGSPRAMVTALVHDYLNMYPDIRSVANIGAFVDTQCAYLAPRHPGVSFVSVDRYEDLAKINSYLPQSPNWSFLSGYPLDMLCCGILAADLIFMTSTSICCPHRELAAYIAQFSQHCRVVIFNEPWWPSVTSFNFWKIPRPEEIDPNTSLIGLAYFNFQSNYIYFLEKHGFVVKTSRIVPTAGGSLWYTLQIIAENQRPFH